MEKRSPYSIFFFLLLCLTARGRLVSSAGVSCSAIGGNGGNCEELRWGEVRLAVINNCCITTVFLILHVSELFHSLSCVLQDGSGSGYNLLAGEG